MFEKDAEEIMRQNGCRTHSGNFIQADKVCELIQKGAEFGYKKGFEFGVKSNEKVNQIVDNEWHYVKDGDLPKDEEWKWCVSYRGYYYVAKYEEMFGCWTNQEYSEVMQPYAWKEIVLPKESE